MGKKSSQIAIVPVAGSLALMQSTCPLHGEKCLSYVRAAGSTGSGLLIIGEGPGTEEIRVGLPFVGPSGQLLSEVLREAGIDREDVLVTNVVSCFGDSSEPRTPTKEDISQWAPYVYALIQAVRPKCILTLGDVATRLLLPSIGGVESEAGAERIVSVGDWTGLVVPSTHPAHVLRGGRKALLQRAVMRAVHFMRTEYKQGPPPGYEVVLSREVAERAVAELLNADRIAYDCETEGDVFGDGRLLVVAIACRNGTFVFPVDFPGVSVDYDLVDVLRSVFVPKPGRAVVAHNGTFDNHWLRRYGVGYVGQTGDTLLAAHILDETRDLGLDRLVVEETYHPAYWLRPSGGKPVYQQVKRGASQVPWDDLAMYCAWDAFATLSVWDVLIKCVMADAGLYSVFSEIMMPMAAVVEEVEATGLPVDKTKLEELELSLLSKKEALLAELSTYAQINWDSHQQVAHWLYEVAGLPVVSKTSGGAPSTDKYALSRLRHEHPAVALLLQYRETSKQLTTYIEALRTYVSLRDGRLHPSFYLTGADTGRLSSSPNVQNFPRGEGVRDVIAAGEGKVLVEADLSQIELRVAAVVYEEPTLLRLLREGRDLHTYTATHVFGKPESEITPTERFVAKTANFSLLYGAGPNKVADILIEGGMLPEQAGEVLQAMGIEPEPGIKSIDQLSSIVYERFHRLYPRIKIAHEEIAQAASKSGFVRTMFGRCRRIYGLRSNDPKLRGHAQRQACNTVVQSAASDIACAGVIKLRSLLPREAKIINLVHDSVLVETPESIVDRVIQAMYESFENPPIQKFGVNLGVPLKCEVKVGKSWGSMKPATSYVAGTVQEPPLREQSELRKQAVVENRVQGNGSGLLEHARKYVSYGWSVFPLDGKVPIVSWTGYRNTKPTDTELSMWFREGVATGIGVITGKPSGLVVIDADVSRGGLATLQEIGLDSPARVRSGGGGIHLYFRYDGPEIRSKVNAWPGVDVKAEGGYVVAPPSLHPSGNKYVWESNGEIPYLPEWVAEMLVGADRGRAQSRTIPSAIRVVGNGRAIPDERIQELVQILLPYYTEGQRHALNLAIQGWLAKRGFRYDDVEAVVRGLMDASGDREVRDRLRVLSDTYEAVASGRLVAGTVALEELIGKEETGKLLEIFGEAQEGEVLEVLPAGALSYLPNDAPEFLVEGWLPYGGLWLLSGHSGVGKTTLALQIACQMAAGVPVLGIANVPRPVRVLYIQADNPRTMFNRLVSNVLSNLPAAGGNLFIANLAKPVYLTTPEGYGIISRTIRFYSPDFVIFDSLREFHNLGENDPREAALVAECIRRLREDAGGNLAICYLHHHSKGERDRPDIEQHLGSVRFMTPTDIATSLKYIPDDLLRIKLTFTKTRWMPRMHSLLLKRDGYWFTVDAMAF